MSRKTQQITQNAHRLAQRLRLILALLGVAAWAGLSGCGGDIGNDSTAVRVEKGRELQQQSTSDRPGTVMNTLPPKTAANTEKSDAVMDQSVRSRQDNSQLLERHQCVSIPAALTANCSTRAMDPPSDEEVLVAWEKAMPAKGGLPLLHETQRSNLRIVKEKIADYVDPPRHVPTVGPAQLHHAHYKCTIQFHEVNRVGWPIPHTSLANEVSHVVYVDHNHFHLMSHPGEGSP